MGGPSRAQERKEEEEVIGKTPHFKRREEGGKVGGWVHVLGKVEDALPTPVSCPPHPQSSAVVEIRPSVGPSVPEHCGNILVVVNENGQRRGGGRLRPTEAVSASAGEEDDHYFSKHCRVHGTFFGSDEPIIAEIFGPPWQVQVRQGRGGVQEQIPAEAPEEEQGVGR